MNTPEFPGYEQLINGVYRKSLEPRIDEIIVLLRSYIPTKREVLDYLLLEAHEVQVTTEFDEAFVKKLELADKQTQAALYALPPNVLQDLRDQEPECMDYINKFMPDPREESDGHEWHIDLTCGRIPDTLHYKKPSQYVLALPGFSEPYGVRWFTKVYLKDFVPSSEVQEQNFFYARTLQYPRYNVHPQKHFFWLHRAGTRARAPRRE